MKLPLEIGTRVSCRWINNDNEYHRVKVIERRLLPDSTTYEYYIHYSGCEYEVSPEICPFIMISVTKISLSASLFQTIDVWMNGCPRSFSILARCNLNLSRRRLVPEGGEFVWL